MSFRALTICALAGAAALSGTLPASAQKKGGILQVYSIGNPPSASLHEEGTITAVEPFSGLYNNLVMFDPDSKQNRPDRIVPDLATEWSWSNDRTALTFKLRDGVKWHDGKPFTAADVKCTFEGVAGLKDIGLKKNPRKGWYFNLKEVTTSGDREVTFHLARPQPSLIMMLASNVSPVYPCHVGGAAMRQKPVGTGPYRLVEFKPNDKVVVARNPDYWKPGRPYLDGIEWKIIANRSTRVLAFVAGNFDKTFSQDITIALEKDIKLQSPKAYCEANPFNIQGQLLINREAPPFDNEKIRRAMMLTIDRKAFIDILSEGRDLVGGFMLAQPEGFWGLDAGRLKDVPGFDPDVERNRAEARKIMTELGYGPDKPLVVKVGTRDLAIYRDPAVILIDHLKQVFIKGELDVIETSLWYTRLAQKNFQVALNVGGSATDDPDITFYEHFACGSERNYTNYCNKAMQARFDQQSIEPDLAKRKALVQGIDLDLQKEGARSTIYQLRTATCWHPYVKGITLQQNSQYNHWRLENAWLDK
ncbi:MAG: ABC transporter substrate-binding protein [Hyphomicrobiaceae bacterium]